MMLRTRLLGAALPAAIMLAALALYLYTGAPTASTGDQAEHQLTAWLVGVPHATGYPLFTLANALAARVLPVGNIARRVTMMTALWSALAVMMGFVIARRISGSVLGGVVAAVALAGSAEFWSLAVIPEVYTLQALLIFIIWWCLLHTWAGGSNRWLYAAAFVAGLGTTHHGSFVPIVLPALFIVGLARIWRATKQPDEWRVIGCAFGWALLGLTPWLYLAGEYLWLRPFDYYRGQGLPYHYYWGNPSTWRDVLNLALGAGFRSEVFTHGWGNLLALSLHFVNALRREFWWLAFLLGGAGALSLLWRDWRSAYVSGLVFISAALFGINVGGNIPKAHVYFLPAYVMWSVWVGVGAAWLAAWLAGLPVAAHNQLRLRRYSTNGLLVGVVLLELLLGRHRLPTYNRSQNTQPYTMAGAVLQAVAPHAVILCRWELCMALRYRQFVEQLRLDVQTDQTEPEAGVNWADRARLYLPRLPVYALGYNQQLNAGFVLTPTVPAADLWQVLGPRSP